MQPQYKDAYDERQPQVPQSLASPFQIVGDMELVLGTRSERRDHETKPSESPSSGTTMRRSSYDGSSDRLSSAASEESKKRHSCMSFLADGLCPTQQPLDAKENTTQQQRRTSILLLCLLIFAVLSSVGIVLVNVSSKSGEYQSYDEAINIARETGATFSQHLDLAILPLFSIAQFATELDMFADLPEKVGQANEEGSLPFLTNEDGSFTPFRNVTGVCDDPELVARYSHIATAVKRNAEMNSGGTSAIHNLQLAPHGVICLLEPMINTNFEDGSILDSTGVWGLDVLNDPINKYIARNSLKQEDLGIAGPLKLMQCPTCGLYFIARLPIRSDGHQIEVDGQQYARWGFATALINWDALVKNVLLHDQFEELGFDFQLTRTDRTYNETTDEYDEKVVILAKSDGFGSKAKEVETALQTTNNEWVITVQYDDDSNKTTLIATSVIVSFFITCLVYIVLVQKQVQTTMRAESMAQDARVGVERNMTAYFAHELRNPLSAMDCALASMPDNLPSETQELVSGMQLCSSFMSNIMNNLLDVRKIEEGKMVLRSDPLSLESLVRDVQKMNVAAVRPGVELNVLVECQDRDCVLGDIHRIQQILNNLVTNAIKYTMRGSITLVVGWEDDLVRLECRDTGPGIPKDEQEILFERFVMRGGAPGSGLGLAIAKKIVDLMHGSIRFESDPSVKAGTSCIVLLALEPCEEMTARESEAEDKSLIEDAVSILIIDDIKMNRTMLKRRIQKGIAPNCIISEAATGEQALLMCETDSYDVIIVDQYMEEAGGVMRGTDAIAAMRRSEIDSFIIGCSGNDLEAQFLSAGADLVWQKPMPSNSAIIRQLRERRQRYTSERFAV